MILNQSKQNTVCIEHFFLIWLKEFSKGWIKELELVGVGYRASNQGQKLELALGFSHNIVFQIPTEVKVETVSEKGKNPIIKLTSLDKQLSRFYCLKD